MAAGQVLRPGRRRVERADEPTPCSRASYYSPWDCRFLATARAAPSPPKLRGAIAGIAPGAAPGASGMAVADAITVAVQFRGPSAGDGSAPTVRVLTGSALRRSRLLREASLERLKAGVERPPVAIECTPGAFDAWLQYSPETGLALHLLTATLTVANQLQDGACCSVVASTLARVCAALYNKDDVAHATVVAAFKRYHEQPLRVLDLQALDDASWRLVTQRFQPTAMLRLPQPLAQHAMTRLAEDGALTLQGPPMRPQESFALSTILRLQRHLTALCFHHLHLHATATADVANALPGLTGLRRLTFEGCHLDPDGMPALAVALGRLSPTLQSVSIRNARVPADKLLVCVQQLAAPADAVTHTPPAVEALDLSGSAVAALHAREFGLSFAALPRLQALTLADCALTPATAAAIVGPLAAKAALTALTAASAPLDPSLPHNDSSSELSTFLDHSGSAKLRREPDPGAAAEDAGRHGETHAPLLPAGLTYLSLARNWSKESAAPPKPSRLPGRAGSQPAHRHSPSPLGGAPAAESLLETLANLKTLRHLDVGGNYLPAAGRVTEGAFAELGRLSAVHMQGVHLGPGDIAAFVGGLPAGSVRHLELDSSGRFYTRPRRLRDTLQADIVSVRHAVSLASAVSRLTALTALRMCGGPGGADAPTPALVNRLPALPALLCLALRDIPLGGGTADKLAACLPKLSALQELSLPGCALGVCGVARVARSARACLFLRTLDLSCNVGPGSSIGQDWLAVGEGLAALASLTALSLHSNGIPATGVAALAHHLPRLAPTFTGSLYLGGCELLADGAAVLAAALQGFSALQELSLRACGIDDAAAGELAPAARRLGALQRLDVAHNQLTAAGFLQLAIVLGGLPELAVVYAHQNKIVDATGELARRLVWVLPSVSKVKLQ